MKPESLLIRHPRTYLASFLQLRLVCRETAAATLIFQFKCTGAVYAKEQIHGGAR